MGRPRLGRDVALKACERDLEVDDQAATVGQPDPRRVGDDPLTCVRGNVRGRLVHVAVAEVERGTEEGVVRLLVREVAGRSRNALGDPGKLASLLVDDAS